MDMPTPEQGGVPAAPNRCFVEARIVSREQNQRWGDKSHLSLELLGTQDIEGPNFARALVGSEIKAFGFDVGPEVSPGSHVRAEAEFHGDERGGTFQLSHIHLIDQP